MPTTVASGQNAYVSFTDGTGSAQLVTATGLFDGWTPNAEDVGTEDVALGTGQTYKFIYRTDYTATFAISAIPAASMAVALRLKRWLESGGQCVVATQDLQGNTYTCIIAPKQKIKFAYDSTFMEFTMTLPVLNTRPGPMLCLYEPSLGTGYTITVAPSSLSLGTSTGEQATLVATIKDPNGSVVTGIPVQWSTSNGQIATVSVLGVVTAQASGNCSIIASIGSTSVIVPCAVQISNTAASVSLSPSSLAFTPGTTYVGTPQVGKSGVPTQTVTATVLNGSNVPITPTPGLLTWTATGGGVTLTDNGNGTCTVLAVAGGISGTILCQITATIGTSNVVQASENYTTQAGQPAALIPSTSTLNLTAPGSTAPLSVVTVDPYGVQVP